MGVHGLWSLLEPVGKPVPLETLENKILAVDISIWLHQATKGFRDVQGNALHNAHLLGLCHRLCKLLFYKIKPVFVFDGGVPLLKRQTMASRQKVRSDAVKNSDKVAEKIISNYIRSEIINQELGNKSRKTKSLPVKKKEEKDLFELPPMPEDMARAFSASSSSDEDYGDADVVSTQLKGHTIHSVDFSSETFRCLPTEVQHEILLQLKDTRKQNSWGRIHEMPQQAMDFSGFQMQRLLKRRHLQERLDEVMQEIGRKNHEHLNLNDGEFAVTRDLASDETTRYVLIKKALSKAGSSKSEEKKLARPDPKKVDVKPPVLDIIDANVQLLDEEFTQEELLFISGASQSIKQERSSSPEIDLSYHQAPPLDKTEEILLSQQWIKREKSASSERDSDLEEVPLPCSSKGSSFSGIDRPIKQEKSSSSECSDLEEVPLPDNPNTLLTSGTSQSTKRNKTMSSEEDSDFEEVPPSENAKQILLTIPINKCQTYNEEEDIFADVFRPAEQMFNITSQPVQLPDVCQIVSIAEEQDFHSEDKPICPENDITEVDDSTILELPSLDSIDDQNSSEVTEPDAITSEVINEKLAAKESLELGESSPKEASSEIPNTGISSTSRNKIDNEMNMTKDKRPTADRVQNKPHVIDEKRREELNQLNDNINAEQSILIQQHGRQERLATSITDQMYLEAQEMLRLFGIPYLVAPMEAEAQCAFLDAAGLTHGTITDDSDIWLFGGRQVYKNFFNQGKYVEFFEVGDIEKVFKLGREKLIHLALLTGSDYTEGIESVGPVTALEILAEFSSEGIEGLERFRDWLLEMQTRNSAPMNKIRHKLRNLKLRPEPYLNETQV